MTDMPNQEIDKGRRNFLRTVAQVAVGGALSSLGTSGCGATPEGPSASQGATSTPEQPTKIPTETPQPLSEILSSPTPKPLEPTPDLRPTVSPEAFVFPQIEVTAELLKQGFFYIGGPEDTIDISKIATPTPKETENVSWKTIEGYTSLAWNEQIALDDLTKDEVKAVKAVIALGARAGIEGFYKPGEALPQFGDLTLLRLTLTQLLNNQDLLEAKLSGLPKDVMVRKGTHLTVLGLGASGAIVAVDEGFDRSKPGIVQGEAPRHYLAVLPVEGEGVSLEKLLNSAPGWTYQNKIVEYHDEQGKVYHQELNVVEPTLAEKIKREAGVFFMDRKPDGSWYENPVVPYPPQEITQDPLGEVKKIEDRVVAMGQDGTKELAEAKYNSETKEWGWEAIVIATPTPEPTSTPERPKKPELIITPQYTETVSNDRLTVTLLSDESLPDEARVGIKPGREGDLLSFLEEKFVAPFRDEGRQFWAVTETGSVLPEPVTIDWTKPIEIAWTRGTKGVIRGPGGMDADSFNFVRREDGSLRIIMYYPPVYFTEDGKFSPDQGPPEMFEAGFSLNVARLPFLISQEKFMQGRQGYSPDEFKAWFAGQPNNDYDHRVSARNTMEEFYTASVTMYK